MSILGSFDPLLGVLVAAYRLPRLRPVILFFGLVPAITYALPPEPCGCIRIPFQRCSSTGREGAYLAAVRSDLKNLASQEEIYFSDNDAYSSDPRQLGFVSSTGVSVMIVAGTAGWSARAVHYALGEARACTLYFGTASSWADRGGRNAQPGEIACDE